MRIHSEVKPFTCFPEERVSDLKKTYQSYEALQAIYFRDAPFDRPGTGISRFFAWSAQTSAGQSADSEPVCFDFTLTVTDNLCCTR